jgi:hypothetical protein
MSKRTSHVFLTLKEMRIAKVDRQKLPRPCAQQVRATYVILDAFVRTAYQTCITSLLLSSKRIWQRLTR